MDNNNNNKDVARGTPSNLSNELQDALNYFSNQSQPNEPKQENPEPKKRPNQKRPKKASKQKEPPKAQPKAPPPNAPQQPPPQGNQQAGAQNAAGGVPNSPNVDPLPKKKKGFFSRVKKATPKPKPKEPAPPKERPPIRQKGTYPADKLPKNTNMMSAAEIKQHRHKIRVLILLGAIFLALIVCMILSLTVFFRVNTIEIIGQSKYSLQEIESSISSVMGQNLFMIDEKKLEEEASSKLPYIRSVDITRHLPSTVRVEVVDMKTLGGVKQSSGEYVIIGSTGRILEKTGSLPGDCPEIYGVELKSDKVGSNAECDNENKQRAITAIGKALEDGNISKITYIDLTDEYDLKVLYDNKLLLELGTASDLEYKFKFFNAILKEGKIDESETGVLNLSLAATTDKVYFTQGEIPKRGEQKKSTTTTTSSQTSSDGTSSTTSSGDASSDTSSNNTTSETSSDTTSSDTTTSTESSSETSSEGQSSVVVNDTVSFDETVNPYNYG